MYDEIKIFEGNRIRSIWNEEKEEWYFSIIDILGILTESENPRKYWSVFKPIFPRFVTRDGAISSSKSA